MLEMSVPLPKEQLDTAFKVTGRSLEHGVVSTIDCVCNVLFLNSSNVRGRAAYTPSFRYPHRKKSGCVRSGDLDGHRSGEIIRSSKELWISAMDSLDVWHVESRNTDLL